MKFSQTEMAILAQLAYKDVPYNDNIKTYLSTVLESNKDYLYNRLGSSYHSIIDGLIDKVYEKDYTIVKSVNDKYGTGFSAFAIKDPDNIVTVVCRGTEGFDLDYDSKKDVWTDIQIGISVETNQQQVIEKFMRELEDEDYNGYYFTGHSLGGNLAIHGALTFSDTSKILEVMTFNAPGFNEAYLRLHAFSISKIEDRLTHFQNEYDYVSSCFEVPGNVLIVESAFEGNHIGFDDHSMCNLKIDDDGSFMPNKSGSKRIQTQVVTVLTEGALDTLWANSTSFLYFFVSNIIEYAEICRDFSSDAKAIFVDAAKETEEEKWWDITRWDCWYKVEQFFGGLEWDLYAGKVDDYYRKIVDINDASVADIETIFSCVYELDTVYASKLTTVTDRIKTSVTKEIDDLCDSIFLN